MPPLGPIILLLLLALPLLEIAVLIKVGAIIGIWMTFAIILGTFVLGTMVIRLQGLGIARRFMERARSGEPPLEPMMETMLLMFAGGCLIAPGFITDAIGLILLVPPIRRLAARAILSHGLWNLTIVTSRGQARRPAAGPSDRRPPPRHPGEPGPTIDADYERLDERTMRPGPPTHDRRT